MEKWMQKICDKDDDVENVAILVANYKDKQMEKVMEKVKRLWIDMIGGFMEMNEKESKEYVERLGRVNKLW